MRGWQHEATTMQTTMRGSRQRSTPRSKSHRLTWFGRGTRSPNLGLRGQTQAGRGQKPIARIPSVIMAQTVPMSRALQLDAVRSALPNDATLLFASHTPCVAGACDAATIIAIVSRPASERLHDTTVPDSSTKHARLTTRIKTEHGDAVDLIEATAFCAQLLRGHPIYTALLLDRDIIFQCETFDRIGLREVVGAPHAKACAHQAAGLTRGLLDGSTTDAHVAAARWKQVSSLLAQACYRLQDAPAVDTTHLVASAVAAPLSVSAEHGRQWRAMCEAVVACASVAERAAPSCAREQALERLEGWLSAQPVQPGEPLPPSPPALTAADAPFEELLAALGAPRPSVQIISAVQSGSAMYGLALPSSDCDYHLVYLSPVAELLALRAWTEPRKLHLSRAVGAPYGAAKDGLLEYTAVELSHYVRTLTKGNPSALELLFVPDSNAGSNAMLSSKKKKSVGGQIDMNTNIKVLELVPG